LLSLFNFLQQLVAAAVDSAKSVQKEKIGKKFGGFCDYVYLCTLRIKVMVLLGNYITHYKQ